MKNRILTFVIGVLVGAILATVGFLVYSKSINKNLDMTQNPNQMMQFDDNGKMQRPNWENMGEPPAKPDGMGMPNMEDGNV